MAVFVRGDQAFLHRRSGCDAQRLAIETAFAEETLGFHDCDDRFLALIGCDDDFDLAFLNVVDRIRRIALHEYRLILAVFRYLFSRPYLGEKHFGVEPDLRCFSHKDPPSVRGRM
jgi:hypothetical protein